MFDSKFRNINVLRAIYRPKYRILKPELMVGVCTCMRSFENTLNCHLHLKKEMTVPQKPTNVVLCVPSHLVAVVGL